MDLEWLNKCIELIRNNIIDKAEKDGVKIYRVKNIVRIDITL